MYSNPNNSAENRIEFLEQTISNTINLIKHMGIDTSDLDDNKIPFEQFIGREFARLKYGQTS